MKFSVTLMDANSGYAALLALWQQIKPLLMDGKRLVLTVRLGTRSIEQNRIMWSILGDLSRQVEWFGKKLKPEGWKDFLTAHLNGQELVPNMDGTGFVALAKGKPTSDMTIAEMTAVIDLGHCFGDERGVEWSKTSLGRGWGLA